ncbi:MAG: hypothetical protein PHS02_04370 [Candidatus ainarchaeum sp.]|nr:hypothetical protein [Candidatus ainarchaeum sp.]
MDINEAWKSTCRIIFGEEIGALEEYGNYLNEAVNGKFAESCVSGQPVFLTSPEYCERAKFMDYGKESRKLQNPGQLDVNEIKDMDSLVGAIGERMLYSGNKVLGNSAHVEKSDNVIDSNHVINSALVYYSKYVAHSYIIRESECMFSVTSSGECSYLIRCFDNFSLKRSFECMHGISSSNCFFSYNLTNCNDCMFCFNQRNASHSIGNIALEKSSYKELKDKLLDEMLSELKREKRLPFSIVSIA